MRAFHESITRGAPVRAGADAARDDVAVLLSALRLATGAAPQPRELSVPELDAPLDAPEEA